MPESAAARNAATVDENGHLDGLCPRERHETVDCGAKGKSGLANIEE
ncbi:MAG: hypothetical protein KGQ37_08970 [Hyphomicrobiales bacterium]|nr:hypothetical protein [Hyphomicrobiales bacterium]